MEPGAVPAQPSYALCMAIRKTRACCADKKGTSASNDRKRHKVPAPLLWTFGVCDQRFGTALKLAGRDYEDGITDSELTLAARLPA